MRLFACKDGALINPLLVALFKAVQIEGKIYIQITMAGADVYEYHVKSEATGQSEIERFKDHFESLE